MVLTEQQTNLLHAALELALGTWDKDPENDALNAVAELVVSAAFGQNELVIQAWDPKHGHCYDCNAPAAYRLPNTYGIPNDERPETLRCSTCAAVAASDGEEIVYLFGDDLA